MNLSVYEYIKKSGAWHDNHESDLYIKASKFNIALCRQRGVSFSFFTDNITGDRLIDIPFNFTPFWEKKLK